MNAPQYDLPDLPQLNKKPKAFNGASPSTIYRSYRAGGINFAFVKCAPVKQKIPKGFIPVK